MMEFRLIDVVSIISKVPRSQFEEVKLAQLAESILECEGVLTPPVLKVIGLDSYEVIEGDREYYAAVVAREKNPRQGEMINAFVVPPKYEENIRKQLAVLHRRELTPMVATPSATAPSATTPSTASPELAELAERFDNFQQVVNSQLAERFGHLQQVVNSKLAEGFDHLQQVVNSKLAEKFDHFQEVVKSQFDKNDHDRIEAKETPDKMWQQLVLIETLVKEIKEAPAMVSPISPSVPFQFEPLPSDCEKATVVRLQAEAKKRKIKYSGMRKAELIEALKKEGAC